MASLFKIKIISPKIILMLFPSVRQVAKTMLRFAEHYESPKFRGKIFTLERSCQKNRDRPWLQEASCYFNW